MTRSLSALVGLALALTLATGTAGAAAGLSGGTPADTVVLHAWDDGHIGGWGPWGWGMALFGLVWMALLVGVPIRLSAWLTRRNQQAEPGSDRALQVLREQCARGEMDHEEFERRRSLLS